MRCARCDADNRPGRRFCSRCGGALSLECLRCGFANEPGERFCGGCGSAIGEAQEALAGDAASASAPVVPRGHAERPVADEGERRPITVLFADLSGYTRLSQALDPEAVHGLLQRYYACVDRIVVRFGGTIDKHIGDAVMALFGAPLAHGDDPLRAVRAAAAIQAAMPALGRDVGRALEVHIGIAGGEVIASDVGSAEHRSYTVIGHSVNLASRLLGVAKGGQIVVDERVHAETERHARYATLEDVAAKGIDAPIRAYRFLALADAGDDGRTSFVGRDSELGQLLATLDRCTTRGRGGTVLIRGEPGIGKSRLVREVRAAASARGFACHTGLVLDFGAGERDAVRQVAASLLGLDGAAGHDAMRGAVEHLAADAPDDLPFLFDLADLPQSSRTRPRYEAMDNATRQRGRVAALCNLVSRAARDEPQLVVVEDIHWADRATLAHLSALARSAGTLPLVLALTSRLEGDPLDGSWRAEVRGSPLITVDLGPLSSDDALALAGTLMSPQDGLARRCVERAAGNPLFLEQLLRAASENAEGLPASLHSLVLSRVDRLPEADRAALRAASVVGQRFTLDVVRHLAHLPGYVVDTLVAHFLVLPDGDDWMFAHALIRDGVYASLTLARRAELHRAAAAWFAGRDLALSAEHLDRAGAPEAPAALLAAARAQASALHVERALALADRGAALGREPDDIVALQLLRSELLRESGEGRQAADAAALAFAAARDPGERCRALIASAAGMRLTADIGAALDTLSQAEQLAQQHELVRESTELHYLRGNLRFAQGKIRDCRLEHEAALDGANSLADPEWQARALSGLADADYAECRMRTAAERFGRCIAICEAKGYKRIALVNRVMVGNCLVYLLDAEGALREIGIALREAREVGNRHAEMFALECMGLTYTWFGRYKEASPHLEESLALAERIGAKRYQAVLWACLAEGWLGRGDRERSAQDAQRALALSRETGMAFCGPMALATLARVSPDDKAEPMRAEAEAILASGSLSHCYVAYHRDAIEDAIERGRWDRIERHAAALESFTTAEPQPYVDCVVERGRLLAAQALDRYDPSLQERISQLRERLAAVDWRARWP